MEDGDEDGDVKQFPNGDGDEDKYEKCKTRIRMEDKTRHFILGTPILTMAKAVIKFDKGTITLRSGKSKISFHRIPESLSVILDEMKLESSKEVSLDDSWMMI
nr:hypothetical protein [Tanacetum cinerariifolium]